MKNLFIAIAFFFTAAISAQEQKTQATTSTDAKPQTVEASCGQCNFGMKGGGCTLAVRIDGKPYFVEGTDIHKHGDAHASDGFCSTIRKADITGEIVGDKYKVTFFVLHPQKVEAKK